MGGDLLAEIAQDGLVVENERLRRDLAKAKERTPSTKQLSNRIRDLELQQAHVRELAASIEKAASTVEMPPPPPPRIVNIRPGGPVNSKAVDIVFHVSDLQYGMLVGSEVPGGRYSPDVWERERLPRFVDAAVAFVETVAFIHPIRCVWFAQGGDFCEGDRVYKGQEWHLAIDFGVQIARGAPLWGQAVATIAGAAKKVGAAKCAVVSVVGNHGQQGGRSSGAMPHSANFDYIFYEQVKWVLRTFPDNGGIDFYDEEPRRAVYFDAAGHTFLMTHGDQDMGGGIIGFAGVNGTRNDIMVRLQTGLNHRYHLKGHWHKGSQISPGGDAEILWNGSWEGPTNLSIGRGGGAEPMQRAYAVHPEFGRFMEWPIRLAPGMSRKNKPKVVRVN